MQGLVHVHYFIHGILGGSKIFLRNGFCKNNTTRLLKYRLSVPDKQWKTEKGEKILVCIINVFFMECFIPECNQIVIYSDTNYFLNLIGEIIYKRRRIGSR